MKTPRWRLVETLAPRTLSQLKPMMKSASFHASRVPRIIAGKTIVWNGMLSFAMNWV